MSNQSFIVITTIHAKTPAVTAYERRANWQTILVGDAKSKPIGNSASLHFLPLEKQQSLAYTSVAHSPLNHYARKNIGYLYAMGQGASIIFDADDDNIPYESFGVAPFTHSRSIELNERHFNIYRHFTDAFIWPRGFPLDLIRAMPSYSVQQVATHEVGVWQCVADVDPDVDAIYRLLFDQPVTFKQNPPVTLPKGVYCPINSQSTAWQPKAFPFLYLPITVSFRFTDILRGYIAQRLMWEQGLCAGFAPAVAYQERNPHNLLADFKDEVPVYLNAHKLVSILDEISLTGDPLDDLRTVYVALLEHEIVQEAELRSVDAWIADCHQLMAS